MNVKKRKVECSICDRPATCFGRYEDMKEAGPSCDEHCSHSCEDGSCEPIDDLDDAALSGWLE